MPVSFRTTILVLAALASSSVAPAQVLPASLVTSTNMAPEPLLASNELPRIITPVPVEALPEADPVVTAGPQSDGSDQQDINVIKSVPGESLASMVSRLKSATPASRDQECLAGAIYFESKSEPLAGQLAVGEVIANRAKSGRFASTYCGVVFQRGQFSFVRGHAMPGIARSGNQWKTAVAIAAIVDARLKNSAAPRALFFHATRVSPAWHATRVATIGNHIFYR
ncbi:cell wall hydrolase [Sphingomonas sp.]|uniref:cell wall hydrolase n=1 Tax=Sphingomonas sp. TaxID=28214 RepID=UPI0025E9D925|nr:cell wall hydrolase [Sphingomonas sp.]